MGIQEKQIYYLSELKDYKVDGSYTDVSGWLVKDSALRNIGTVKNLLVNKQTERVVYLDVEVDSSIIDAKHDPYGEPGTNAIREFINEAGENHIILPIGLVDINVDDKYVFTESIDHTTFAETKRIKQNTPIERDYETAVLDSYARRPRQAALELNADMEHREGVNRRDSIGENRDVDDDILSSRVDKYDWFDVKKGSAKTNENPEESRDITDFYGREEFKSNRLGRNRT
ncbi:MAG: hypothetical protein ACKVJF_07170 [Flavobacteriales bacterium]